MKNKIQKNNEKNTKKRCSSPLMKCGSLLLISLFVVLCTIVPSFASSGEYEIEDVSKIEIIDSSSSVLSSFIPPFNLNLKPNDSGDYTFDFSSSYFDDYPNGSICVYSNNDTVLQSIKDANGSDGSVYNGIYTLDFLYLSGHAYITIPGSVIVKPTILDNIFSIFSGIGSWIASIFTSLIGVFWLNGSFTPLGVLSLVSLAFGVGFLLITVISRFLRFRG